MPPEEKIGRFVKLSSLGKGGMGEVYLARDPDLERNVAIKFLNKEFTNDADKLGRFEQEAKAASALNHAHILTVFELGQEKGQKYIVTEFIEGKNLTSYLSQTNADLETRLELAAQITSALAVAHDAGIIHRDLKPANIMVRDDGNAKILDFGLAKLTDTKFESTDPEAETIAKVHTVPGMILGTPSYMSPEQARSGDTDSRSDIFSMGILMYEMFSGEKPFIGESYADIMSAILKEEPAPLKRLRDDVPAELESIIKKCLRKEKENRYQTASDLLRDIRDLQKQIGIERHLTDSGVTSRKVHETSTTDAAAETLVMEPPPSTTSSFLRNGVIGVLLIGLIGFVGWWFFFGSSEPSIQPRAWNIQKVVSWNSSPGELFSSGRFSPDGKMVAFSSATSGSRDIWLKQTSDGSAIQITKDSFNNEQPIWSPDGNEVAYFSDRGNSSDAGANSTGIWRVAIIGGTPTSVGLVVDGSSRLRKWSSKGVIYFESNHNLYSIDVKTGETSQVTRFSSDKGHTKLFAVSPKEDRYAYIEKNGKSSVVKTNSLTGENPVEIGQIDAVIEGLMWHPNREVLLFSALVNNVFQLFAISQGDDAPTQLTSGETDSVLADISQSGEKVLISSAKEESDLWKVDVESDSKDSAVATGLVAELWNDVSENIVAFQSVANLSQGKGLLNGNINVLRNGSSGDGETLVENGFLPRIAPDGKTIAFLRSENDMIGIWTIKSSGGTPEKLKTQPVSQLGYSVSPYNQVQTNLYTWSPNGQYIAYVSLGKNGLTSLRLFDTKAGTERELTPASKGLGYYSPIWSSDGTKLAFSRTTTKDRSTVYGYLVYDLESKEFRELTEFENLSRLLGWTGNDEALLVAESEKFGSLPPFVFLQRVSLNGGAKSEVAKLEDTYLYNLAVSPDGSQLATVKNSRDGDNIFLVALSGGSAREITNNSDENLLFAQLQWSPDGNTVYFGKQRRFSLLSMITNFPK